MSHDIQVVLDHNDGSASLREVIENGKQPIDIGHMQAGRRLIEDIQAAFLGQSGCQFQTLALAAGQGAQPLFQRQIAQSHSGEPMQWLNDVVMTGLEMLQRLFHREVQNLGNIAIHPGVRACSLVESRSTASIASGLPRLQ